MFKDRLRTLRKNKKMSQSELAEVLHVSQQTVGSWEVGRSNPDEETINKIADFFNVTTDYLYGREVPEWASEKDVMDLEEMLNSNVNMAYGGENLTEEEKEQVKRVLTGLFWEKLEQRKRREADE